MKSSMVLPKDVIQNKIYTIRDVQVMLHRDLQSFIM
jgi:hypothetical protein